MMKIISIYRELNADQGYNQKRDILQKNYQEIITKIFSRTLKYCY